MFTINEKVGCQRINATEITDTNRRILLNYSCIKVLPPLCGICE